MKRALLLVLVCAGIAVAAASAARDPKDEQERLNPTDMASARKAVVQLPDLNAVATFKGRWKSEPPDTGDDDPDCANRPDLSDLTITGKRDSRQFSRADGVFLGSETDIYETADQVRTSFRRSAIPGFITCFNKLSLAESDKDFKVTHVSSKRLATARLGEQTARYQFVYRLTARETGNSALIHWDVYFIVKGRAGLSFLFTRVGGALPAAAERQLIARVLARV